MSVDAKDFLVFDKYRYEKYHAFSNNLVSETDKDSYAAIFQHLRDAVEGAIATSKIPDEFDTWICNFGRDGGAQGHRPKSLWASVINRDSEAFSKFPQAYVIASETGVEIGFSVTIHEDDYYDVAAKQKNRTIVPIINAKLPDPESTMITSIAGILENEPGWIYAEKTRNGFVSDYPDLSSLVAYLKSENSTSKGGGAIYRILDFEEAADSASRVEEELKHVLSVFRPLMQVLQPTSNETQLTQNMSHLAKVASQVPAFDPADDEDGRKKILAEVAVRQGQAKFREELLQAYDGRCAITGCTQVQVLQAAHISPYNGPKSNHVSNGLPLRADIHTLFDLGLLRIDPETRTVSIAPSLAGSEYEQYAGILIADPEKSAHRPLKAAFAKKLEMFPTA